MLFPAKETLAAEILRPPLFIYGSIFVNFFKKRNCRQSTGLSCLPQGERSVSKTKLTVCACFQCKCFDHTCRLSRINRETQGFALNVMVSQQRHIFIIFSNANYGEKNQLFAKMRHRIYLCIYQVKASVNFTGDIRLLLNNM